LYDNAEFVPYPRVPRLPEYLAQWGPDDVRTTAHVWDDCISILNEWRGKLRSFLQVRFAGILGNPQNELGPNLEFAELPPIREDNKDFWDKLSGVGKTHHKNKYGDFAVIEEICRENMRGLNYN